MLNWFKKKQEINLSPEEERRSILAKEKEIATKKGKAWVEKQKQLLKS